MTDAYKKARDEKAKLFAIHGYDECICCLDGFIEGADWAIAYERECSKKLVEALKDMIRNSRDIVAKKQCSDYLALYEAGGVK